MNNAPSDPVFFHCGATMKNRFMLAPMTNCQSHEDGCLSEEELHWLTMRAKGQFGVVMTCAAHVQEIGKGFPGQLGIFSDTHIAGHQKLTTAIQSYGSLAVIQLHHAGMRSPKKLIGQSPVCPSVNKKAGARALSLEEVHQLKEDFIEAAIRAKNSGYDGVEVHGAHGYILTQFLSSAINNRTDIYGGTLENRARLLFEIVNGIRKSCGSDFLVGVRLSPERFGMDLAEVKIICQQLINQGNIDFLDLSLWDCFKQTEDERYNDLSLLDHFIDIDYKEVLFTVAGKIRSGPDVFTVLNKGVDFVAIGQAAILHFDFPLRVLNNPQFRSMDTPVSASYLKEQGLAKPFIEYMRKRPGFVV